MRRSLIGSAITLLLWTFTVKAEPASPLRVIPNTADVVVQVKDPRALIETITKEELTQQLLKLPFVDELLKTTQVQRFFQLVKYYERDLGKSWPDLLDDIAGNGIVLATKIGNGSPAVVAFEGRNADTVTKFTESVVKVIEQELTRQGVPAKIESGEYEGVQVYRFGNAYLAHKGTTLLFTNKKEAGKHCIALLNGNAKDSLANDARLARSEKILPKDTLVSLYVNFEPIRKIPDLAIFLGETPEPVFQVLGGPTLDILRRTPFVTVALAKTDSGYLLTARAPKGTKGMGKFKPLFIAEGKDMPPSRPLLTPKGTIFSTSFYWDLSKIWTDRYQLLGDKTAKQLEQADRQTAQIPIRNLRLSKLLSVIGPYHRIVVTNQKESGYKHHPNQTIPALAFITEPRDLKEFKSYVEPLIRGGGLFLTFQVGLSMEEKEYKGCKIVGYRFTENSTIPGDTQGIRFNFSPCFFTCEGQFVVCSTLEQAPIIIDDLQAKSKMPSKNQTGVSVSRIYTGGIMTLLETGRQNLVTQTVLDQGVSVNDAKKQVEELFSVVRKTGGVSLDENIYPNQFEYNVRFHLKKATKK